MWPNSKTEKCPVVRKEERNQSQPVVTSGDTAEALGPGIVSSDAHE